MFEEGETVIDVPVPAAVPPHEPVNHCDEALPPTTVKVVLCPLHIVVVPVMEVGGETADGIVAVRFEMTTY